MDVEKVIAFCILIIILYTSYIAFGPKNRYLLKNGISTVAKVIKINKTTVMIGERNYARPQYEIVLEIENAGISDRHVTIKHVFYDYDDIIPNAGDNISVLVDPRNPEKVILSPNQNVAK